MGGGDGEDGGALDGGVMIGGDGDADNGDCGDGVSMMMMLVVVEGSDGVVSARIERRREWQGDGAFLEFFKDLFGIQKDYRKFEVELLAGGKVFTQNMQEEMVSPITSQEMKEAVFSMHDDKSLGPDGFCASFFKKAWVVMGQDICEAIMKFFYKGKLLKQLNSTLTVLIPKIQKIFSYVVGKEQSAFVKGRDMFDNVLLAHELTQHYDRGPSVSARWNVSALPAPDSVLRYC